jgi:hypothetical protein
MSMSNKWIVRREDDGRCFGPFTSADRASKWATRFIKFSHWVIVRLRCA